MEYVCLNPRVLTDAQKMHEHLWRELHFQELYGMNLDALYDELTSLFLPVAILCLRFEKDGRPVYPHAEPFYRVIEEAAEVNRNLRVDIEALQSVGSGP